MTDARPSDSPAPDSPTPDSPTPDSPTPDSPTPDSPAPASPTPDSPAPASPAPSRPVVLRHEDDWDELRRQIDTDRAAGLAPSVVRHALAGWFRPGSFVEIGTLARRATSSYRGGDDRHEEAAAGTGVAADGLVAGWGRRSHTQVFVAADDPTLGSDLRGAAGAAKARRVREHALDQSAPLVQILAARRLDHDVFVGAEFARFGYGVALDLERESAERILQIAIVTGPVSDQAAIETAWSHVVMLAGPDAAISGHTADAALDRGLADAVVDDLPAALTLAGDALDHLPPSCFADPPEPADPTWCLELAPRWQGGLLTCLRLVAGRPVGVVDVEPSAVLTAPLSRKALRLVRFCRSFRLPLIVAHGGLERPPAPRPADVDALDELRRALAATTVLEAATTARSLETDLGVRPLWSIGPAGSVTVDEIDDGAPDSTAAAVARVVGALPSRHHRPDQDPRVRAMRPRSLQGS